MKIQVDLTDHVPIYIQLMNQVKHMIATGELQPGDQLPTVRQLAADLRVNFNTVARAYRLLDEESIISTQHGRGTYILEPASEERDREMRRNSLKRLIVHLLNEADSLGFTAEETRTLFETKINAWENSGDLPNPDDI
ncbi:MAG TPA: GntR family transcriptional regulator [Anaerolineales bacterium]|nr:GntR family transcriptional regulator [Anaerolineales bacterium]